MPFFRTSQGTRIYYEVCGKEGREPVILLHGLGADMDIWRPQVAEFEKRFHVFLIDLPGHGQSTWQDHYDIQDLPDMFIEFMDEMGLEKAHFIGNSIGSTAAILFAAKYPEATTSVILQGPAGGTVPFKSFVGFMEYLQLQFTLNSIFLFWAIIGKQKTGKIINWIGQTYKYSTLLTGMEERMDPRALKEYSLSNGNDPYKDCLPKITTPVLIIRGTRDQFVPRYSQYIKNNISSEFCLWIEVPFAEHLVALKRPLEFNMAAIAFIQQFQKTDCEKVLVAVNSMKEPEMIQAVF